jgi:hypothetical protein
MKLLSFTVGLMLVALLTLRAELISSNRLYTTGWAQAGVAGGIPDTSGRTVYTTITSTGDTTDRLTTINNAIAACPSGQIVALGAGTFRITGQLNITNENGVVLRGSGAGVTTIDSTHTGAWGVVIGNTSADYGGESGTSLTVNSLQGSTTLTMASTSAHSIGDRVAIVQGDSTTAAWPVVGNASAKRHMAHRTKVTDKTGTTLTIADPVPFDFNTAQSATVRSIADGFAYQSGIEDLTIAFTSTGAVYGVSMWNADECWLKGVEIKDAANYLVFLLNAIHCTIQKSYLNGIQGAGNNGSGLLMEKSSMNLFHDNIVRFCQPNVEINYGCTGNVVAYNAMLQSQGNISLDPNHGAHNAFNLYEGNVCPNLKPDGYFGSVSHDTVIRNRFTGADDIGDTQGFAAVDLKRFTRYYNVVGNILALASSGTYEQTTSGATGAAVYQLGYPNVGNATYSGTAEPSTSDWWADYYNTASLPSGYQERDLDVGNTLIRKGNYNTINAAIPAGESAGGDTIPDSYYLSSKPAWFYGLTWPAFDSSNPGTLTLTASYERIPAGYRYINGIDPPADSPPTTGRSRPSTKTRKLLLR